MAVIHGPRGGSRKPKRPDTVQDQQFCNSTASYAPLAQEKAQLDKLKDIITNPPAHNEAINDAIYDRENTDYTLEMAMRYALKLATDALPGYGDIGAADQIGEVAFKLARVFYIDPRKSGTSSLRHHQHRKLCSSTIMKLIRLRREHCKVATGMRQTERQDGDKVDGQEEACIESQSPLKTDPTMV